MSSTHEGVLRVTNGSTWGWVADRLARALAAVSLGLLTATATAQQDAGERLPTDTELLAGYCSSVVKARLEAMGAPENAPLKAHGEKLREDHGRLIAYIGPRVKYLDVGALAAAVRRGTADQAEMEKVVRGCFEQCPTDEEGEFGAKRAACVELCMTKSDAVRRVRRCDKLDWLPL